jgi:hypothetical protein
MSITFGAAGKAAVTSLAIACASLALVSGAQAQSRGGHGAHGGGSGWHGGGGHYSPRYHGGGYRRGGNGWVWGGVGLGLGLGLASYYASPWNGYYGYSDPGYVVVNPPVVYDAPQTVYSQPVYSQPVPARSSQPVIYPRNGQSAAKMDADANACSEWAGHQPNATSDPSVFMRGTQACMDARGYTVR